MNNQEKLRKIFNQVDPAGIFFDENQDEYDPEIKELLSLSPDYHDVRKLNQILREIFKKYFEGVEINSSSLDELATKISNNWER